MGQIVDKQIAFKRLELLVKMFKGNLSDGSISSSHERTLSKYKATEAGRKYSEAQVRQGFILPMFRDVLGWDIDNSINEVIPELHNQEGFADYVFVRNNQRKFVLETKKPHVNVDPNSASGRDGIRQAIGYARSLKDVNISLVSNFEVLVFAQSYTMPRAGEEQKNVLEWIYFEDLLVKEKFDLLWEFRFEQADKASFCETLLENLDSKIIKKNKTIDENLLDDLKEVRLVLADNLSGVLLDVEEADRLTQYLINRIIFMRVLEDRGIVASKIAELIGQKNIWGALKNRFHDAHSKFPIEILNTKNDSILDSKKLLIDDSALSKAIQMFYDRGVEFFHDCYDFKYIPSDILGYAYEHSIAFKLTYEKGEYKLNKKEFYKNGVHYTPAYISRSLSRKTIEKSLNRKENKNIEDLICADIACGSGSFLTGLYEVLYSKKLKLTEKDDLVKGLNNQMVLSLSDRKNIIEKCIFGIDIDNFAVEVSKLSLMLKFFEEFPEKKVKLEKSEIPDIENNIICADSLLDTNMKIKLPKTTKAINSRHSKVFNLISKKKFDVVVGNPPYIKVQDLLKIDPANVKIYQEVYKKTISKGAVEFAIPFIERASSVLSKNGELGFIVPNKIFKNKQGNGLRSFVTNKTNVRLEEFIDFNSVQIFDAGIYTCLIFLTTNLEGDEFKCSQVYKLDDGAFTLNKIDNTSVKYPSNDYEISNLKISELSDAPWKLHVGIKKKLIEKLESKFPKMKTLVPEEKLFQGLITGSDKIYFLTKVSEKNKSIWNMTSQSLSVWSHFSAKDKKSLKGAEDPTWEIESKYLRPIYQGSTDLKLFEKAEVSCYLLYPYDENGDLIKDKEFLNSSAYKYLNTTFHKNGLRDSKNKILLKGLNEREEGVYAGKEFYQFSRPQNLDLWAQEKIMFPYMVEHFNAHLSKSNVFVNVSTGGYAVIPPKDEDKKLTLLAVLNSEVFNFLVKSFSGDFRDGWFECSNQYVGEVPMPKGTIQKSTNKELKEMYESLYELNKGLNKKAIDPTAKLALLDEKNQNLSELNSLVSDLYELSSEEWNVVEFYSAGESDEAMKSRFEELNELVKRVESTIDKENLAKAG